MASWKFLILILPATIIFLAGPAYGHGCGHHGNCGSRTQTCAGCSSQEHGCAGCDSGKAGNRWRGSAASAAANFETHSGKIAEILYLPGATPAMAQVELRLMTGSATIPVRLGPSGFLKQHQVKLKEGEEITVTGYRVDASDGDVLVAGELSSGGRTVRLRDRQGRPLW
jgi:hypothetical protein